jgi:microcystin-dependent protein
VVDNVADTIGLNPATNAGDLMTWDGSNWIAAPPAANQGFNLDNMQPFVAVNYIIALQGVYPSRSSADPLLGEIIMFAGNFAPRGWAFCNGQLLPISQYTALFSILGTTYGGDGRTTFALPDLRGRVPVGPGQGPGLTNRPLGARGGSERVIR